MAANFRPTSGSSIFGQSIPGVSRSSTSFSNLIHCLPLVTPGRLPVSAAPRPDVYKRQAQEGIIQGDSHSASIAAASILAKTYRDSLMVDLDELYPEYGFSVHKGYGTAQHYEALRQYGPCPIHRQSFLRKFTF